MTKTLDNTDAKGARAQVPDLEVWGDGDAFKLLCKASSKVECWMKSTKAMPVLGSGCVVQVTTQQSVWNYETDREMSVAVAEAVCFVPGANIVEVLNEDGAVVSRQLQGVSDLEHPEKVGGLVLQVDQSQLEEDEAES